jgi:ubiquinone/menaquinone biosynthesis C-methylase UbiE
MGMELDRRVIRRYEMTNEDARLWVPGKGDLVRLRTWDIFDRYLPPNGRIVDVGGGTGTHAAHLAEAGYEVTLVDPIQIHLDMALERARSSEDWTFEVHRGDATELPADEASCDAVLLMGPLYHLIDPTDRQAALRETRRVLRPGGVILAEVICRHAWVLDATLKGLLDQPDIWDGFTRNIESGLSQDPDSKEDGSFWAYFHKPEELRSELAEALFGEIELLAVEGFGWLLGDLDQRMLTPDPLLRAIRLTESEPSMLGCSAHVIGIALRP